MNLSSISEVLSKIPDEIWIQIFIQVPAIIGFIWKVGQWKARVDYDLDNFGKILGTEKGLDRAKKRDEEIKRKEGMQ